MIFKDKNESGYALPTVLLIVVIFMIIILSFMGRSFSSIKQNQIVEKSSQSVSLAEMGITYYQVAVQNIYAANKQRIGEEVIQQINTDKLPGKTLQSDAYYVNLGISKMKSAIKTGLGTEKSAVIIDTNNGTTTASFSRIETNYFESPAEPKILLKVQGNQNGKTTILSTEMNFSPNISGVNSSSGTGYIAPTFTSISQPQPNDPIKYPNYCKDPNTVGTCQSIAVTTSPKTFTDNFQKASNLTIYSTGVLTIDAPSNANNMSLVNIHTNNNLTIGGNVQNASKITFEVIGKLSVVGQFKLNSGSKVFVKGTVDIAKNLWINAGSLMCVDGTIDAKKVKMGGGILVIKNNLTEPTDWAKLCGTSPTPSVNWADKVYNNVNYEY